MEIQSVGRLKIEMSSQLSPASSASSTRPFDRINVAESAALGALRGLTRIPFEHPFDTVKTKWQANPTFPNSKSVFLSIYRTNGIKEFYSGAVPSAVRSVVKESYRYSTIYDHLLDHIIFLEGFL